MGKRRLISISCLYAALAVAIALLPALVVLALVVDLIRRRQFASLRLLAFCLWYLLVEAAMLPRLAWTWLRWHNQRPQLLDATAALQMRFAGALFAALRTLFRLKLEVTGLESVRPGPLLVLVRHTSIADTLLPTVLLSQGQGLRLRFVLKRELLVDPCLDVAGNRLPNHFVSRERRHTATDLAAIQQLATGIQRDEGVLIYPEGTRFTVAKRTRAIAALQKQQPEAAALASTWHHVLPPKSGGVLAALAGAPDADVLWMAHAGLEGLADLRSIWGGGLVGQTVRVAFWRTARAEVPAAADAQTLWLFGQWARMDAWVASQSAARP